MAADSRIHKVTGVVIFKPFHLDAPGLVGQEEAEDKKQALVAVGETEPHVMVIRPGITYHEALGTTVINRPAHPDLRLVHDVLVLILR